MLSQTNLMCKRREEREHSCKNPPYHLITLRQYFISWERERERSDVGGRILISFFCLLQSHTFHVTQLQDISYYNTQEWKEEERERERSKLAFHGCCYCCHIHFILFMIKKAHSLCVCADNGVMIRFLFYFSWQCLIFEFVLLCVCVCVCDGVYLFRSEQQQQLTAMCVHFKRLIIRGKKASLIITSECLWMGEWARARERENENERDSSGTHYKNSHLFPLWPWYFSYVLSVYVRRVPYSVIKFAYHDI